MTGLPPCTIRKAKSLLKDHTIEELGALLSVPTWRLAEHFGVFSIPDKGYYPFLEHKPDRLPYIKKSGRGEPIKGNDRKEALKDRRDLRESHPYYVVYDNYVDLIKTPLYPDHGHA